MNGLFEPNWAQVRNLIEKNFEMEMNETWFEMHRFFQKIATKKHLLPALNFKTTKI